MDMDTPSLIGWLAAVRTVHFIGCLLIAGVWVFNRFVVTRSVANWRRTAIVLLSFAIPLAMLSGAAWFVIVAANMSDLSVMATLRSPAILRLVWFHTRFGRTWQIHTLLWITETIVTAIWVRFGKGNWAALFIGSGLVIGLAWAGHGDTGPIPGWHLAADVLHLLACEIWPSGLVPFLIVIITMSRLTTPDRWEAMHRLTKRFSAMSLAAVATLTATGLVNSFCLLGSFSALLTTRYGLVLSTKIILFALMVGLGAINLLMLKPRLAGDGIAATHLKLTVTIEIILATLVVAAVGLLGMLEPARL